MQLWSIFGCSFLFGVLGTWLARVLAHRVGFLSRPNPIVAEHKRPVAYLGGLGIAVGVLGAALFPLEDGGWVRLVDHGLRGHTGLVIGATGFLLLGVADDARSFSPRTKFALQFALAALTVDLGVSAPLTHIRALDALLSVFYILTFLNAFNFTDVCDGLLASVAVVFFLYLAIVIPTVSPLALAVAGATSGFLVFNRPAASIFMGDAGSHFLGFLAAALVIAGARESHTAVSLCSAAIACGVPLFETGFITVVRVAKGLPWWRGSPDHFSLRLQAAGLRALQVDLYSLTAGVLLGALGVAFAGASWIARLAICGALLLGALALGTWLLSLERHPPRHPLRSSATRAR